MQYYVIINSFDILKIHEVWKRRLNKKKKFIFVKDEDC